MLSDFDKGKYNYGNPNFCAISGFQTNKELNDVNYVFKMYAEHTKDHKGGWDSKTDHVDIKTLE